MSYLKGCAKRAAEFLTVFVFVGVIIGLFIGSIIFLDRYINNIGISFAACFFLTLTMAYIFIPGEEEDTMKSKLPEDGITRY